MQYTLIAIIALLCVSAAHSQTIESIIDEVTLDSLVQTVRDLSGEDSTIVNGEKTLIRHRVSNSGNDLAADYIKERLEAFDVSVTEQVYSAGGRNVIAYQTGELYPDSIYIVCAHYDAVAAFCADDNATGVAAIIEAVRLLSNECFAYTIAYAFWDEEEIGLRGSDYFARQARIDNQRILGVINLEMLGYDSNNDMKFEMHINSDPGSIRLKDSIASLVDNQALNLSLDIIDPGQPGSDHSSFWRAGYPAIVYGQSFFGGDSNPAYHTSNDKIGLFNMQYFHELSRLTLGALAALATPCSNITGVYAERMSQQDILIHPNPVDEELHLRLNFPPAEPIAVEITDVNGRVITTQSFGPEESIYIDVASFTPGIYFVRAHGLIVRFLKN